MKRNSTQHYSALFLALVPLRQLWRKNFHMKYFFSFELSYFDFHSVILQSALLNSLWYSKGLLISFFSFIRLLKSYIYEFLWLYSNAIKSNYRWTLISKAGAWQGKKIHKQIEGKSAFVSYQLLILPHQRQWRWSNLHNELFLDITYCLVRALLLLWKQWQK